MPSRQGKEIGKSCAEVNYVFQVIFVLYKRRESRARVLTNFMVLRNRVFLSLNYTLEISLEGLLSSKRASWGWISTFIPEKSLISQKRLTNNCSSGEESQIPHPSLSSLHQSNPTSRTCWKLVSPSQSYGKCEPRGSLAFCSTKYQKYFGHCATVF